MWYGGHDLVIKRSKASKQNTSRLMHKDDLIKMIEIINNVSVEADLIFKETDGTLQSNFVLIENACSLQNECSNILNSISSINNTYNNLQKHGKT